ncbi:MAG: tol-pal system protein YbgF [Deltaproteobacteria bacterium]|nr:tol-pal system protein YbgF [Deltaproteobacteria bacterium]
MKRAFIFLGLFALCGCASQQDLESLQWEVNALQTRVVKSEQKSDELKAQLAEKDRLMNQCLSKQADMQAQYADLQTQLFALQGSLEELSLRQVPSVDTAKAEIPQEQPKVSLYQVGLDNFDAGHYADAVTAFESYLAQNPDQSLVDNAHFWIGEALFAQEKYEDAILEYDLVIKQYKSSEKMPDSLLKQGLAFIKLNDTQTGELIFRRLIKDFPDSEAARKAKNF